MAKNNLRDCLDQNGLTQQDLARESGISYSTVNRTANQRKTPSPSFKTRMVEALSRLAGKRIREEQVFPSKKRG